MVIFLPNRLFKVNVATLRFSTFSIANNIYNDISLTFINLGNKEIYK